MAPQFAARPSQDKEDIIYISLQGEIEWWLHDEATGKVVAHNKKSNLIVSTGISAVVKLLIAASDSGPGSYFAVGSGTVAPVIGDISLGNEVGRLPVADRQENPVHNAQFTAVANTQQLNGTHTEVGLFAGEATSALDSGLLVARTLENINKTGTQTLTYVWRIAIT